MTNYDSLLTAISKYYPRENHSPIENFTTEAFAWLLRNSEEASKTFVSLIDENYINKEWKWSTQVTLNNGARPDLVGTSKDLTLVIEVKVDAELHENQLENYKTGTLNDPNYPNSKIILLTKSQWQHKQDYSKALIWEEIHNILKNIEASDWKIKEIVSYLDWLVNPFKSETAPWFLLPFYTSGFTLINAIRDLFSKIAAEKKNEHKDNAQLDIIYDTQWGRNGIRWKKDDKTWDPGFFTGIMEHQNDHEFHCIQKKAGTPFGLIISFNKDNFDLNLLTGSPEWTTYVSVLKKKFDGWNVYDAFRESSQNNGKLNPWHPIFIWKPFFEVVNEIKGNKSFDGDFGNELKIGLSNLCQDLFNKANSCQLENKEQFLKKG